MSSMVPQKAIEIIKSNWPPETYTMLREALQQAILVIDQFRWRDSYEEFQQKSIDALVWNGERIIIAHGEMRRSKVYWNHGVENLQNISHWIPLPEPH